MWSPVPFFSEKVLIHLFFPTVSPCPESMNDVKKFQTLQLWHQNETKAFWVHVCGPHGVFTTWHKRWHVFYHWTLGGAEFNAPLHINSSELHTCRTFGSNVRYFFQAENIFIHIKPIS